jgi:hypothetical protein
MGSLNDTGFLIFFYYLGKYGLNYYKKILPNERRRKAVMAYPAAILFPLDSGAAFWST